MVKQQKVDLIIKNGTYVTHKETIKDDIAINKGKIFKIGNLSNLNAKNQAVMKRVGNQQENPYLLKTPGGQEDITWLLK